MANNETKIVLTASDQTKGAFDSATRGLASVGDKAAQIDRSIVGLGANFAALGGAVAGALSVSAVKGAIDMADELDHLAQKTGIAVESLSALRYAGEIAGTPMESLEKGVRKLSQNMADAAGGAKEQGEVFKALGLSVKDLSGNLLPADKMLGNIADKFASYQDGTGKAALAMQIFGKAGADLIPLLNAGSDGIAELTAEAKRLGVVFGSDLSGPAAEFNDNLTRLKFAGEGFALAISQQVLPTLTDLSKMMTESSGAGLGLADALGSGLRVAMETVAVLTANVSFVLKAIGREIGAIGAQAVALATLDIKGFNAISEAVNEDANRARADLDALERRILGIASLDAGAGRGNSADPRQLGAVGSIAQQTAAWKALAPVVDKAAASAKTATDEFAKLYDKITGKANGLDAEFGKNLATLKDGLDKGRIGLQDYIKTVETYIQQQPFAIEATKAATKAAEERQTAALKEAAGIDAFLKAQSAAYADSLASVNARITALQDEEAAVRLAAEQNISLALAIEQVAIQRLREQQAKFNAGSEGYDAIQKEIEARQRLLGLMNTQDLRERETKGWAQVFQSIDDTAHDAWTNVWQSGTDAFKRIGQTLKAAVLDVLYQMTVRPFIVKIGTSVLGGGFAGAANAATGSGSSVLGSIGDLSSLAGIGGSLFGSTAAYAGAIGGGSIAAGSQAAMLAAQTGVFGAEGLAMTASAAGGMAGAMAPVLQGLMTAAPYLAAVAAVYMIAKSLDKSGTPHTGGGSQYSAAGGLLDARSSTFASGFTGIKYSDSGTEFTSGIVKSVVGILDSTATAFGKQAGYTAAASFADDTSKDGAWGSLRIADAVGTALIDWQASASFRTFSDGTAGNNEYLSAVSTDVRAALDSLDLPGWASNMLAALGDAPGLDQLAATVSQINATQVALAGMGKTLAGFADLSDTAVQALIAASGGIEALAGSASSYYQNFYPEKERLANTRRLTFEALSGAGVDTAKLTDRAAYRTYVEYLQSIVDTEPAAAGALAAMLSLNQEFASFVPAVEDAAGAIARSTKDIEQSLAGLIAAGQDLQAELLAAQGDSTGAAALRRTLDTAGFTDAELAAYDYNQQLQALIDTTNAAAEAAANAAQERTSIEGTLLQALGETATLRQRELAALDPSNRALQAMVYAVADAQSAIASLTSDIARLDQVAAQAATLSNSISVALGGQDNTEAGLWDVVNSASATAEERLAAVGSLINIINGSISTDTAAAVKAMETGAQAAQQAIQDANAAQTKAFETQISNAEKMLDLGKQLRDYVQGLRIGNLSALTPAEKLALAASAYNKSLSGAQAGDAEAMASLQGNASTYLEQARQFDPGAYTGIFAQVTGTLDQFGGNLLTEGQQAQATAQAQLDQLSAISAAMGVTASEAITGNVISDANRTSLESLLGLTTQIQADAVIEKADKQAQLTIENERMEAIRASLSDDGTISVGINASAAALTSLPTEMAANTAAMVAEIRSLNERIATLEATLVSAAGAQANATVQSSVYVADTVANAVSSAIHTATSAPEVV